VVHGQQRAVRVAIERIAETPVQGRGPPGEDPGGHGERQPAGRRAGPHPGGRIEGDRRRGSQLGEHRDRDDQGRAIAVPAVVRAPAGRPDAREQRVVHGADEPGQAGHVRRREEADQQQDHIGDTRASVCVAHRPPSPEV
jgi:hypothetical protein